MGRFTNRGSIDDPRTTLAAARSSHERAAVITSKRISAIDSAGIRRNDEAARLAVEGIEEVSVVAGSRWVARIQHVRVSCDDDHHH